jgi:hypothetical protein
MRARTDEPAMNRMYLGKAERANSALDDEDILFIEGAITDTNNIPAPIQATINKTCRINKIRNTMSDSR